MEDSVVYRDMASRTGGEVYLGVVGPVRSGKSTFIKQFMETLVLPYMGHGMDRERAQDELPQSAGGKTIMTTEPKFVPEKAAEISPDGVTRMRVRLIDCVGYIVPSSLGYIEDEQPRMVKTPWYEEEIPFNMAAEEGTKRVITDHSTVGIVVTTDGTVTDIPREEYEEAEERVIRELQEIHKPFTVLYNTVNPHSAEASRSVRILSEKYGVPVFAVNCAEMQKEDFQEIFEGLLTQFELSEIRFQLPSWYGSLKKDNAVRRTLSEVLKAQMQPGQRMAHAGIFAEALEKEEVLDNVKLSDLDMGTGIATVTVDLPKSLYYETVSDLTGETVQDDGEVLATVSRMASVCREYRKIEEAMRQVEQTGYGIVMPEQEEMILEEPEIIRQSGRYGVRLRASAPSIHMMRAQITTEVSPIVGTEKQSEELVTYLLDQFSENPSQIWESNIFGTSLYGLVNEGLHNKLNHMPEEARMKMKETVERIINEGCNGLICIIV